MNICPSRSLLRFFCLLAALPVCFPFLSASAQTTSETTIQRIAFGSCAHQNKQQPIWEVVHGKQPDLFLFLGDNIYGDTKDMDVMKRKYQKLAAKPGFQTVRDNTRILSTWDDHDYGKNDAGAEYAKKEASEEVFLNFFRVPDDSPRRSRPGVYGAYRFGPEGQRTQVILLDTRYFRDPPKRGTFSKLEKRGLNLVGWYQPTDDTSRTILGEAQWNWLEEQLKKPADLRIIASSIQVVPWRKGMECWGNFPHERRRLFKLIEQTDAGGALFVSGDVHFSELSRTNEGPYPLYDFTSSSLTHPHKGWAQAVNKYRIKGPSTKPNFGLITIQWNQSDPVVTLQTITLEGTPAFTKQIHLSELRMK